MTPLSAILARIGWTVPHLAGRLGLPHQTVYRWHSGRNTRGNPCSAPADVIAWLERVAAAIEAEPPPAKSPAS